MNRMIVYSTAVLAMLLSVSSCSVKENRTDCPCYVSVMTQTDTNCVVSFHEGIQLLERKAISAELLCTGENYTSVKRGTIAVSAVMGTSSLEFTDSSVCCRSGRQYDEVYAFAKDVSTECESVLVQGDLHKQYCKVKLYVKNSGSEEYPYKALFKASSNGMLLSTLQPASGQFIYEPLFGSDNGCDVLLPRQKSDGDIYLQMTHTSGRSAKVDLGKYFLASAYDWEAESLSDIIIVIDFSLVTISIKVNDWTQVFILKYEI